MSLRRLVLASLSFLLLGAGGCRSGGKPRPRLGCYPTTTVGTRFLDPEHLGSHRYKFSPVEKNGIVYTCNAGHIDITHVRIAADWTEYLAIKSFKCLMQADDGFSYRLNADRSRYYVRIDYPDNWAELPKEIKERIACEAAIKLGQYLAFTSTTWHEIMTWFGYKCVGVFPEYPSAFSWEDSFSNLLGTYVAAQAFYDSHHKFDEAITLAIERELENLAVQPAQAAKEATAKVRGKWFSGHVLFLVSMKKRNFDIGIDDGYVTPTLVPSVCQCTGAIAKPYPVPTLDCLSQYGFSVKLEIEPREMEKKKVLKIAYPNAKRRGKRIEPAIHFARIMDHIKKDAVKKYGRDLILTN
jgi:hypothetical protein